MAAPLLIGLGKALLSQAPKIAAKQLGKKAVKNAAKDFVKGKVKNKLKGKKKKKGGALVRSEDITSTAEQVNETAQKISPQKLLPSSVDTTTSSAVISPSGKTSYEKISQRLDNIIGITGALDKAFKQQLKDKKKTAKATKNARQTERKKAREERLEQSKKSLGIGAAAMSAAKKFGLMDFITNVLLGGLILFLLKQAPKIEKIFNFLTENLYASFLIIRGVLQAFKGAFKQFGKIVRGILKTGVRIATKPFRMAGSAIASGFRRLGNAIFNFARMGLNLIRRGLGLKPIPKPPPTGSGAGKASRPAGFVPRSDARGNQVAGKGRQYRQNLARTQVSATTTPARASRLAGLKANLQTGTAFGGRGANLQRGAYGAVVKGNKFLRKLFNIVNPKEIQALADASPALKKAGNFTKGARIPVVGPLIVFIVNALDPTQSLGQAAFKAIGAGLGEFLGFAIPIPILGPIIGGLVGEVMGDVAYSLIINKNPKEAGQKIMNAVKSVGDIGGKILDWAKGFVGRFFDALPKLEIPGWVPGIGGKEIIDPTAILGPRALIETPKAFLTALFQPGGKEEGKVQELETSASKPYFKAAGGYYSNETRGYLGATEAEARQKLGLASASLPSSPQTTQGGGVGFAAPLFDLIASGEGGYNSMNQGTRGGRIVGSTHDASTILGKNLPDMTVQEVMNHQASGKLYAAGKYQIVPGTMKEFVARGGVSKSDMYDAATQEKFPRYVLYKKRPTVGKYLDGKAPLNDAIYALSAEFASIGVPEDTPARSLGRIGLHNYPTSFRPKGTTLYGGTGNAAHTGPDKVASALQQIKGGGSQPPAQQPQQTSQPTQNTPVQPAPAQQAQKQRIQELQKKIENTEKLLATGGLFAPGTSLGYITRENLKADKAELAKLTAQPLTPTTQNTPVQPAPAQQQQTATPVQPSSSTASQNASQVSRSASYEDGAEQTIIIPSPSQQQQQPMMTPQQSGSVIRVGGSTKDVLNSYYKAQLLGFLYKQG